MNVLSRLTIICAVAAAPLVGAAADAGIEVLQLSQNNALVRVSGGSRYLVLPVQESMPDSKIDILVNGNLERTFYVRLADNSVDYTVPLDLAPYRAKGEVVLNVISETDRSRSRDLKEYVCWDEMRLSDTFDTSNREKYRPLYHHTPLYGWMNDPNGMFYKDGRWHLYYQHNPYGSKWQNITWGHSSSTDLINWEHQPLAIEPNGLGTVFSGSSVVDSLNTAGFGTDAVVAIYTSAGTSQIQSLAYSTDGGMTFSNYNGNPIITTFGEARDPNMFWHEESEKWILLIAHALDHEMLIYSSPDLKNWTFESSFGKGYGSQDGVWECPDLFKLPIRGTDEQKWVLLCNINPGGPFGGSATQYFVGDFDGKTFKCDTAPEVTKWMDYGKDHYAAVSFSNLSDGRHTTMAWMSNWEYANEVPTMQYRSSNTLPRDHDLFIAPDGELYIGVFPAEELDGLRGKRVHHSSKTVGKNGASYKLPTANDGICEIVLNFDCASADKVLVTLANEAGESVDMAYEIASKKFEMDRRKSGMTGFSNHFLSTTSAHTHQEGSNAVLRLFIDRCSVEAFDGDGRFAMTNLVFPTTPYTTLYVNAEGGKAKVKSVDIYECKIAE